MARNGWFNLEAGSNMVPETPFFEGDSAFKSFGLSKTARLYGFIAWYGSNFYFSVLFTKMATYSTAIGFILSLLGSIVLILGQSVLFAGMFLVHMSMSISAY